MKKQLLIILSLIILCFPATAQKTKDVLYLKNGSIIYGKLVEAGPTSFKLHTSDGSLMIYPAGEVEKLTREVPSFEGRKKSGFSLSLESGFLIGAQSSQYSAPFSFNILAGTAVNSLNIFSFGTGVEFIERPFTPLYAEYKRVINNQRVSPFLFARVGGVVPIGGDKSNPVNNYPYSVGDKDYKGGISIGAGTGISWVMDVYETYLSFAYRYAETSYTRKEYNTGNTTYRNTLNRLEVKFGFKF